MNWYIGQEIVCVKTHSRKVVKEGNMYVIRGLRRNQCTKCGDYLVLDVGVKSDMRSTDGRIMPLGAMAQCYYEHGIFYLVDGIYWLGEELFKPLDELADISELTEILSKPIEELFEVK